MSVTRREICLLLPGLLPVAAELQVVVQDNSLASGAFQFDKAPMHVANNNAKIRLMMRGKVATGEGLEVHETTLPSGGAPTTTAHHHPRSEIWLIREGAVALTVNDKHYRLEPGLVGFVRSTQSTGSGTSGQPQPCTLLWLSDQARSCRNKL